METIGQKIRRLIRSSGFRTIHDFHLNLKEVFGKSAINRSTLTRILKDQVEVRERTLNQIALILGVKTSSLREGTNAEVAAIEQPERAFTYNDKATLRILNKGLPLGTGQLVLKKGGRTSEEQDAPGAAESMKWVYVLVGKVHIVMEEPEGVRTITLHKSRHAFFDARRRHHFENASANTSLALVIHYPAAHNRLFTD